MRARHGDSPLFYRRPNFTRCAFLWELDREVETSLSIHPRRKTSFLGIVCTIDPPVRPARCRATAPSTPIAMTESSGCEFDRPDAEIRRAARYGGELAALFGPKCRRS